MAGRSCFDATEQKAGAPTHNCFHTYYQSYTKTYLEPEEIFSLYYQRTQEFIDLLKRQFDRFDSYPRTTQLALLDMAYNLGVDGGIVEKFPKFTNHVMKQEWRDAAEESKRRGIQEWRNKITYDWLLEATHG